MLPAIDIPITLPFEVPVLLHPPLVHFAIVLPVIILILEFSNLFMKRRAVSVVSLSFLTLLVLILVGAYFTGKADGSEAFAAMSGDAKEVLNEHKLLGTYLAYGSILLLVLKFLNLTKNATLKVLYMLVLIGFVLAILHQGKEGGELVFKHGTNVEALADLDEKVFDLEEEVDELKEELNELKAEKDDEATKDVTEVKKEEPATDKETVDEPKKESAEKESTEEKVEKKTEDKTDSNETNKSK